MEYAAVERGGFWNQMDEILNPGSIPYYLCLLGKRPIIILSASSSVKWSEEINYFQGDSRD